MNGADIIRQWVGTPYSKANCWDLAVQVRDSLGLQSPVLALKQAKYSSVLAEQQVGGSWVQVDKPFEGCLVRLSAMHVGIWLCDGVLHTSRKFGAIWQDRFGLTLSGYTPTYWSFKNER